MKALPKQKQLKTKSLRKKPNLSTKKVKLLGVATRSPLRHLKLVEHKHTLKLVHHRHTSHLALFIVLAVVGVFLYASQSIAKADQLNSSGSVSVGLVVSGAPPTVGATITSPLDGTTTTNTQIDVSGTCANQLLVVIYDNGQSTGSTTCSVAGVFDLTVQLLVGANALQALNYDLLNQPGPATPTVTVISNPPVTIPPQVPVVAQPKPATALVSPFVIPALSPTKKDCSTYSGPPAVQGGQLQANVVCFIRDLNPLATYQLGLLIQGGKAPYALNISWGTSSLKDTLVSVSTPGYQAIDFAYPLPGVYTIKIHVTDSNDTETYTQIVAEVNGTPAKNIIATLQKDILNTSWFSTPVPFYLIAVTLTLGFWVGDLFDRHFGAKKVVRRRSA
jgi:hypothetical protein